MKQEETKVTSEELQRIAAGEKPVFNRADRRRKPRRARQTVIDYVHVPENIYTKATHKIKKMRSKHARTKQQRARDAAKVRKIRKEGYTQVS